MKDEDEPVVMHVHAHSWDRPLPDDHPMQRLIGRVATEWANLEHSLDIVIWSLLGGSKRAAACVTSQLMGATPRFRSVIALVKMSLLDDEMKKELIQHFERLLNKTYGVADKRNRIIHDPWFTFDGTQDAAQWAAISHKSKEDSYFKEWSRDQIEQTIDQIVGLTKEIRRVSAQFRDAAPT